MRMNGMEPHLIFKGIVKHVPFHMKGLHYKMEPLK